MSWYRWAELILAPNNLLTLKMHRVDISVLWHNETILARAEERSRKFFYRAVLKSYLNPGTK